MAKYAAAEASTRAVDQAVQTLGGNGLTQEYGDRAAGDGARLAPDRAGQPRDDAQLRRADLAGPAALVLMADERLREEEKDTMSACAKRKKTR